MASEKELKKEPEKTSFSEAAKATTAWRKKNQNNTSLESFKTLKGNLKQLPYSSFESLGDLM